LGILFFGESTAGVEGYSDGGTTQAGNMTELGLVGRWECSENEELTLEPTGDHFFQGGRMPE
jgi:hypothetical protein